MPNWVDNDLVIKGLQIELDAIENKVRRTIEVEGQEKVIHDIAGQLVPMPDEIRVLDGTGENVRRFRNLKGEVVKVDQMRAMSFYNMNDEELLGEGFTMEKLTEDELNELDDKYGAHDWYAWSNLNYGTKWGDCDTVCNRVDKNTLVYTFQTAWSPSFPMTQKIAERWSVDKIVHEFFSIENGNKGYIHFDDDGNQIKQYFEELDESYYIYDDTEASKKAREIFG
tara:strand:- start:2815 stop:3489 length:675 start_codon:yes stop_codon:yes gene_type:complete